MISYFGDFLFARRNLGDTRSPSFPLWAFPLFFSSKDVTDGYDQNYFVDFYTNHVEMVQRAVSYFATCTPKLVTLTFQHPKTPKSSLLLAGLTGQAMQGDFAWVWGA
jgi:hypothetical protein